MDAEMKAGSIVALVLAAEYSDKRDRDMPDARRRVTVDLRAAHIAGLKEALEIVESNLTEALEVGVKDMRAAFATFALSSVSKSIRARIKHLEAQSNE